jgi:organic hydroperoxide reductase OsmC/OhrA
LLGLAIGGCFCNDLQYVAHDMGVRLAVIEVDVMVAFEGNPLLATQASMRVAVTAADKGADVDGVIRRAKEISSVSNSVRRGVPIHIVAG